MKKTLKSVCVALNRRLRRFVPLSDYERECVQLDPMSFVGDLPRNAGTNHHQYRLAYKAPRPISEEVRELIVTPTGMAWCNGALFERYSLRSPAVLDLLSKPSLHRALHIERATLVQGDTPYSYGDWMAEFVRILARRPFIEPPLIVPRPLMEKTYVRRDLDRMGVRTLSSNQPIFVQHATVLRQTEHTSSCWTSSAVDACRRAFDITARPPREGSIVYISRHRDRSETHQRPYPSEMTASVVQEMGGRVLIASEARESDFVAAASQAETVIFDHGSAVYNALRWRPRNFIELFSDQWWNGAFLSFAEALGAPNYALVCVDAISSADLRSKLTRHLTAFSGNN